MLLVGFPQVNSVGKICLKLRDKFLSLKSYSIAKMFVFTLDVVVEVVVVVVVVEVVVVE